MSTEGIKTNLWDKLDQESDDSYARFLTYVSLGPGRTVLSAYKIYADARDGPLPVTQDDLVKRSPSPWRQECAKYKWRDRARAWDIAQLQKTCQEAVIVFTETVQQVCAKLLRSVIDPGVRPSTWQEVLDTVAMLTKIIPPETVHALAVRESGSDSNSVTIPDSGTDPLP